MLSDDDEEQGPPIQDPLVPHENYVPMPSYEDDIIPGPPIEFKSLFEAIQEASTGIPLASKEDTLNYMYNNIVKKVYGPECSPRSHP
eukprot:CAMPEP_0201159708 /NCGR_PEP_ID=MMETSP0851-20130426/40474_1 /ASSEMBLY_ACC=CAM_ASM_000631 /TAXON_ID=183588 /ORGANISM="Pseudo-nitzschia fraudulenta, Strain WWA7" /LENGTH=86 /DNA_ID=CAMNT_0047438697 /DNA_START=77 /DNA_END=337 /DNA_ORIENTATION=+